MIRYSKTRHRGFTLIELAIVLAIAGLLFVGLWRLLAGANQQSRDTAAATLQTQLISAVKGYLSTAEGNAVLTALAANKNFPLTLPTAANPAGTAGCPTSAPMLTTNPGLCNYLPPGFQSTGANATVNSYSQSFLIQIQKDGSAAGTPPNTWSFAILTTGGDTIPDASGGRISGLIGGDGGFRYANAVCGGPANIACGAFGGWTSNIGPAGASGPASFGAADPGAGHIVSRTYISPDQASTLPWLARQFMPGDSPTKPNYNTMTTPLLLGYQTVAAVQVPNIFYLGKDTSSLTAGGTIDMQAGTINMQGGTITGSGASNINMVNAAAAVNPQINISSGCFQTAPGIPANCPYSLQVTGDANISNLLNANALYANTFVYQSSDLRLKTNIHPIVNGLAQIMLLKPVTFNFKAGGEPSIGVIAQDIEKIYPQLVSEGSRGMKAVNYEGLIAPLISAVQELKHDNDDLRARLHDEELRERKLEDRLGSSEN